MTEQFLAVHTLEGDAEGPKPVHVESSETRLEAWFKPQNENYYIVFSITLHGTKFGHPGCRAEAQSSVYLSIGSELLHPDEITRRIGLNPTEVQIKDEKRVLPNGRRLSIINDHYGWTFAPLKNTIAEFDHKLEKLLILLEPATDRIRALKPECSIMLQASFQGFSGQMWGLGVTADSLERLAALGADLDVDLYAGGPELPD